MKVSVIIPVYNKSLYLERAIESVLAQSFSDYELILVDDGSTDGSEAILQNYQAQNISVYTQPNAGPGAARNTGIHQAKGEYLAFLDADDEWLPEYLHESVALLETATKETVAVASGYFEWPSGISRESMWRKRGIQSREFRVTAKTSPVQFMHHLAYMSSWSVLIKKDCVLRWSGFYSKNRCVYGEDAHLWIKVLLNEQVRFNLTPLVKFHRESSGLSQTTRAKRPIEPFLSDPESVFIQCPRKLHPLLKKFLALRAAKTACVLGYWGAWREARELLLRFASPTMGSSPHFLPAVVCATPVGGILGKLFRYLSYGQG